MCLSKVAAGEPVEDWAKTRAAILDAVSEHIEKDFSERDQFVDPLTERVHTVGDLHMRLSHALYKFDDPPFTVQRLAELALLNGQPRQYGREDVFKYLLGFLRLVGVKSTTTQVDMQGAGVLEETNDVEKLEDRSGVFLDEIDWASSLDASDFEQNDDDEGHMSTVIDWT